MDWQLLQDTLAALPPDEQRRWLMTAAGLAALVIALFWLESRPLARSGRLADWAAVRCASLLLAPLTLAALFLPARAVSGMEGLAVFYLMLLTAVPLLWFGGHVLAGRLLRPRLSAATCLALAFSALAILAVPVAALAMLEGQLQAAARGIADRRQLPAGNPPLAHQVRPVVAYTLPGAGLVFTQSLIAAPDTRLVRVEQRMGSQWPDMRHLSHPTFCTQGNDLHLMWSAQEPPPYLRLHWTAPNGAAQRAEFTPALPATPAPVPFTATLRATGLDPVAPIPRVRMHLVLRKPGREPYTQMLGSPPEAGEQRTTDCVAAGFEHWTPGGGWELEAAGVTFYLPTGAPPLRAVLTRGP